MFTDSIEQLKSLGLVTDNDIAVACMDMVTSYFGAIGAAVAAARANVYILSANENEIRLYDLDKKTRQYLGSYTSFPRETIQKIKYSSFFGNKTIIIKTDSGTTKLSSCTKYRKGYEQKEQHLKLKELFNTVYNPSAKK